MTNKENHEGDFLASRRMAMMDSHQRRNEHEDEDVLDEWGRSAAHPHDQPTQTNQNDHQHSWRIYRSAGRVLLQTQQREERGAAGHLFYHHHHDDARGDSSSSSLPRGAELPALPMTPQSNPRVLGNWSHPALRTQHRFHHQQQDPQENENHEDASSAPQQLPTSWAEEFQYHGIHRRTGDPPPNRHVYVILAILESAERIILCSDDPFEDGDADCSSFPGDSSH